MLINHPYISAFNYSIYYFYTIPIVLFDKSYIYSILEPSSKTLNTLIFANRRNRPKTLNT
jgi:hypothetical protein